MSNSVTKQIVYFEKPGEENTEDAIRLALKRAKEGDIKKVIVATSSGKTGLKVIKEFKGVDAKVIPVTLNAGSSFSGNTEWENNKKEFEKIGIKYVQGIQTFSGVERAIRERWGTAGPVMILSDALRLPGEGFKVAIEVTVMAADAGFVSPDEIIISIAGTGRGADTVLIVKPAYSHNFFDFAVREIICKPLIEGVKHEAK
jgi:hypothetical protein